MQQPHVGLHLSAIGKSSLMVTSWLHANAGLILAMISHVIRHPIPRVCTCAANSQIR